MKTPFDMSEKEHHELNVWIASNIFVFYVHHEGKVPYVSNFAKPDWNTRSGLLPEYTKDRDVSMLLLEKCADMTTPSIRKQSDGSFCIWFDHPPLQENYIIATTLPLAIALFAKKIHSTSGGKNE